MVNEAPLYPREIMRRARELSTVEAAGYEARLPGPPADGGAVEVAEDDPVRRWRQRLLVSLVLWDRIWPRDRDRGW